MSLRARRVLYTAFIIAFCVITPLLWLYAAGYEFTGGFRLEKTGILVLRSVPDGARVLIDGKPIRSGWRRLVPGSGVTVATPANIKNLAPGPYRVRLEQDGFWPWEKELWIDPGETTFAEDVVLFRNNLPLNIVTDDFDSFTPSPDGDKAVAAGPSAVALIDTDGAISATTFPLATGSPAGPVRWSPDGTYIIIGLDAYPSDGNAFSGPVRLPETTTVAAWGETGHELFLATAAGAYRYDLRTATGTLMAARTGIIDLAVLSDTIATLERSDAGILFAILERSNGSVRSSYTLPDANYRFMYTDPDRYDIFDREHGLYFILDPNVDFQPLRDIIKNVRDCVPDGDNALLCHSEFEIWREYIPDGSQTILTRLSEPINAALRHPSDTHILFTTDRSLYALELDDRDRYQFTKILELDRISHPVLSPDGQTVFFIATIGNQKGVYRLDIR